MHDIKRHVERNHPDINLNTKSFSFIKSITDSSIKSLLLELEHGLQGQSEISGNISETDEQGILNSKSNVTPAESSFFSESSFTSKSSLASSSTTSSHKVWQASDQVNSSIIETVNQGMEKLLIAFNDLSEHVKGDAIRNKDVERNLRMSNSNEFTDIATKWDKIDNIFDLGKAFPQIRFLPSGDEAGGSVIRCETCYDYIKSPVAPDKRGLSGYAN